MVTLIVLSAVGFACIGFVYYPPQGIIFNPLYTYYFYVLKFVLANWVSFTVGFLAIVFAVLRILKFTKNTPVKVKIVRSLLPSLQVSFLGFLASAVLLYLIAFLELNILAVWFNKNPSGIGIITESAEIVEKLRQFDQPPRIITGDTGNKTGLVAVAIASTGKENIFGNLILPSFPGFFILPVEKPASSMLLIDDTLVVNEINPADIQAVSPVIGYLFVRGNFLGRNIKAFPVVSIMTREEYQGWRAGDFNKKLADIGVTLAEMRENIGTVSAEIQRNEAEISDTQALVKETYTKMEAQYLKCLSAGLYSGGKFVRTNSQTYCDAQKVPWNENVAEMNKNLDGLREQLGKNQNLLADYQLYEKFLTAQEKVGAALEGNIPRELGAFDPPGSIKLTLEETNPKVIGDYFGSLTHEYLHYASYVSADKKLTSSFFEEGLTEYYARMAIKRNLDISTNLGYPAVVKIIEKIARNIPDSDLAQAYFTKDQKGLETALDRVYGVNFYRDNKTVFDSLLYTSDPRQILPLANVIMARIKGTPMTEADILSTYSGRD
jgi:hypothetical protein